MATKKDALRGAKLIKKTLESARQSILTSPEPAVGAKKLVLPNGEAISPAMKELLTFDGEWIGIDHDEDEHEVSGMSLEEIIEETFGEEAVPAFAEAYEIFGDDCVMFQAEVATPACLYVGTPDDAGEYPVLQFTWEDGVAKIGGFIPFDVWVAQQLGGLERGKGIGDVPEAYAALIQPSADANGDGRLMFMPKAGEAGASDEGGDDEDDDKDA
jgi:hypothetical protein